MLEFRSFTRRLTPGVPAGLCASCRVFFTFIISYFLKYTFPNFPVGPVDGGWGEWKTWTKCTKTCGGGKTWRTRECDSPEPAHGGKYCQGLATETEGCNFIICSFIML